MYKHLYRYWFLAPLLLMVLLARDWAEEESVGESVEDTIDMTRSRADYYLEDFETRKLNVAGQPEYVINGESLTHYPADDVSIITEPNLTLHRGEAVWNVVASRGQLTTKPDIFTLEGAVTMQRPATEALPAVVILTRDLRVHTVDNIVESDQLIELKSATWTLKSIGFKSRIEDGTLTLLADVEGHYEIVN